MHKSSGYCRGLNTSLLSVLKHHKVWPAIDPALTPKIQQAACAKHAYSGGLTTCLETVSEVARSPRRAPSATHGLART